MGRSEDDRVIREMLAPNLDDALYALGFWLRRHSQLPFYRRAARREAERSIAFWRERAIADANIEVDMIIQNQSVDGKTDFTFTVDEPLTLDNPA